MVNSDENAEERVSTEKSQPYLTTFSVTDVKPEIVRIYNAVKQGDHIASQLQAYRQGKCGKILQGTTFREETILPANNGFLEAVTEAYNNHHHLILRPDDVWLAIMTQFSFYLNDKAEEFRSKFVSFQGKKELTVYAPGNIYSAPYDDLVESMEKQIHKNLVDPEVRNWIMPNFSTTTKEDRVTSGVVFMAAMKKYFDYKFSLLCGIPTVSLDGTVDDWEDIRRRIEKLETYQLNDWAKLLMPVMDQFVMAKRGEADVKFWTRVCSYEGGGSGPTYLSGWITLFCFFDKEGKSVGKFKGKKEWPQIDTKDIPPGIVEVDVIVDDNGAEYKTTMLAGSMAKEVGREGTSLQPRVGWVIALKEEA